MGGPSVGGPVAIAALAALAAALLPPALVAGPGPAAPEASATTVAAPVAVQEERPAPADEARRPVRYVRARAGGVTVRNFADVQGRALLDVDAGTLLAVHGERAGWLEVDVPGGYPVWVYGRLLRPTDTEGVLEVTGNDVNLRPGPSSDADNFPLSRRLQAGDRVAVIEFDDPEVELDSTWVRVWSPPSVCGWVQAARTEPLEAGADPVALWREAEARLLEESPRPATGARAGGLGSVGTTDATATGAVTVLEALALADALFEREVAKPLPDFDAVRGAYRDVLELDPTRAVEERVATELQTLALLEQLQASEDELERERRRNDERLVERQLERWDELAGRASFEGPQARRGVLVAVDSPTGEAALRLVEGGEPVAELVCASGRFDLGAFLGHELRVDGEGLGPVPGGALPLVDVAALRVVGGEDDEG